MCFLSFLNFLSKANILFIFEAKGIIKDGDHLALKLFFLRSLWLSSVLTFLELS